MALVYYQIRKLIKRQKAKTNAKRVCKINPTRYGKLSKSTALFFIIIILFCGFWYPYVILTFVRCFYKSKSSDILLYWGVTIGCFNSSVNIVIYGAANVELRQELKRTLKKFRKNRKTMVQVTRASTHLSDISAEN